MLVLVLVASVLASSCCASWSFFVFSLMLFRRSSTDACITFTRSTIAASSRCRFRFASRAASLSRCRIAAPGVAGVAASRVAGVGP